MEIPIIGTGIDFSTGKPLIDPIDEQSFSKKILDSLGQNIDEIHTLTNATKTATTFRGEIERERTPDLGDPRVVGWTYLVNNKDPHLNDIIQTMRPLAEHRGMANPKDPLIFSDEPEDEWTYWLEENYSKIDMRRVPHYILIVGGPGLVPFRFQSLLDSAAAVGRLDFDSLKDLKTYVEKIIRLEKASSPVVRRKTIFFATDGGPRDATYYSRRYMAEPLVDHVRTHLGFETHELIGDNATKDQLLETLGGTKPALVYTASHGIGAPDKSLEIQKRFNGAIICQKKGTEPIQNLLFSADDVPLDEPFLEGSVFFQFACFGYGTPAESDFMHWLGDPRLNSVEDFVAALPKRLLAHPRGPIGFIGHLDTAWLHGFADPESPDILDRWHNRLDPFIQAINKLLKVLPSGLAMAEMNKRYDITNAVIIGTWIRLQRRRIRMTPDLFKRLAQIFITRSDAQNYMIFGDPAARLRIPAE